MKPTIYQYEGWRLTKRFIYEEGKLKRIEIKPLGDEPAVDDVYTGQIVNYVPAIKAYFVDFNGYSGLMKSTRTYKNGQVIPVVVVKEPRDDKGYRLSDLVYYKTGLVIHFPDDPQNRSSLKLTKSRVRELIEGFGHEKGILFRTACEKTPDQDIQSAIDRVKKADREARRYAGIRQTGRLLHRYEEDVTAVTELSEILELEEELRGHYLRERVLKNRTRLTFEKTQVGMVIDFDSHRHQGGAGEDHYDLNREMLPDLFDEIEIRDVGGLILVDLISMNNPARSRELEQEIDKLLQIHPGIQSHGLSSLDILQLTRKVTRPGLMSYREAELLTEKLYLRIKSLVAHAHFESITIDLNSRFYAEKSGIEAVAERFDFDIRFVYRDEIEESRIRLNNDVD